MPVAFANLKDRASYVVQVLESPAKSTGSSNVIQDDEDDFVIKLKKRPRKTKSQSPSPPPSPPKNSGNSASSNQPPIPKLATAPPKRRVPAKAAAKGQAGAWRHRAPAVVPISSSSASGSVVKPKADTPSSSSSFENQLEDLFNTPTTTPIPKTAETIPIKIISPKKEVVTKRKFEAVSPASSAVVISESSTSDCELIAMTEVDKFLSNNNQDSGSAASSNSRPRKKLKREISDTNTVSDTSTLPPGPELTTEKALDFKIKPIVDTLAQSTAQANEIANDDAEARVSFSRRGQVIKNGTDHPEALCEPSNLRAVLPPPFDEENDYLCLPESSLSGLSSPQIEACFLAAARFRTFLPSGKRAGFFLGDGTGCGKGRVVAASLLHLWNLGQRRHVWVSVSADLIQDAKRDLDDVGAGHIPILDMKSVPVGTTIDEYRGNAIGKGKKVSSEPWKGEGIVFVTYALLALTKQHASSRGTSRETSSASKEQEQEENENAIDVEEIKSSSSEEEEEDHDWLSIEGSRAGQLVEFLGRQGCGLICFDEAHKAKRGESTNTGLRVQLLQDLCPHTCVVYSSATGAGDLSDLAYASRLGLWGKGTAFRSFTDFVLEVHASGPAGLEAVCLEMKARGLYVSRMLSFTGSSMDLHKIALTESQLKCYKECSDIWIQILSLWSLVEKERNMGRLMWATAQRFFGLLILCFKVNETVELTQKLVDEGMSVVISLWSTGESRVREGTSSNSAAMDEFVSSPQLVIQHTLDKYFSNKTFAIQKVVDDLKNQIEEIEFPINPLDELMDRLGGPTKVSELTGRSYRHERGKDGTIKYVPRGGSANSNINERKKFQEGKKHVAIISEAASTGISLHADKRLGNLSNRRRCMICLQLPWSADKAVQQFGRVHRSNQHSAPIYKVIMTDVGGEQRFVSSIARRIKQLGALTKGDKEAPLTADATGGQFSALSHHELIIRFVREALDSLINQVKGGLHSLEAFVDHSAEGDVVLLPPACQEQGLSFDEYCIQVRKDLQIVGVLISDGTPMPQATELNFFLNRLMLLPVEKQKIIFDYFMVLYSAHVRVAEENGDSVDGVRNLNRSLPWNARAKAKIDLVDREMLVRDASGRVTEWVTLRLDRGLTWDTVLNMYHQNLTRGAQFYSIDNKIRKDTVILAVPRTIIGRSSIHHSTVLVLRPSGYEKAPFEVRVNWKELTPKEAEPIWRRQLALCSQVPKPKQVKSRYFEVTLVCGNLITLWNHLREILFDKVEEVTKTTSGKEVKEKKLQLRLVRALTTGKEKFIGIDVKPFLKKRVKWALACLSPSSLLVEDFDGRSELANQLTRIVAMHCTPQRKWENVFAIHECLDEIDAPKIPVSASGFTWMKQWFACAMQHQILAWGPDRIIIPGPWCDYGMSHGLPIGVKT